MIDEILFSNGNPFTNLIITFENETLKNSSISHNIGEHLLIQRIVGNVKYSATIELFHESKLYIRNGFPTCEYYDDSCNPIIELLSIYYYF